MAATEAETPAAQPAVAASNPVIFPCPQGSASLPIAPDSQRTVVCRYCQSSVYLPDGLWKEIHPVKTAQLWSAVFRLDAEKVKRDIRQNAWLLILGVGVLGVGLPVLLTTLGLLTVTEVISAKGSPKGGYVNIGMGAAIFLAYLVFAIVVRIKAHRDASR